MNIDIDIVSLMTPKVYMVNTNLNIVENGIQISPFFFTKHGLVHIAAFSPNPVSGTARISCNYRCLGLIL